jgi:cell division protein FtsB
MTLAADALGSSEHARTRRFPLRTARLVVALVVAAITASAGLAVLRNFSEAAAGYTAVRAELDRSVASALASGFSREDLAPVFAGTAALDSRSTPVFGNRSSFYAAQREEALRVEGQLPSLMADAMARYRLAVDQKVSAAEANFEAARTAGADVEDVLNPLTVTAVQLHTRVQLATRPAMLAGIADEAASMASALTAAADAARAETAALQQSAATLKAQAAGNPDALRKIANDLLGPSRNDATVASLLKMPETAKLNGRLEHFASGLGGSDIDQVAAAAAGVKLYHDRIHDVMTAHMPAQAIVISLTAQELWAYEKGNVVKDTLVTTGRPALPTDVGAMHVLWKQAPWKMHSPWPRTSQWWYPDTNVRKVVWFTVTGEGLHDANWQPVSTYGPGGQFTSSASHGCVHVPDAAEDWLYDWAQVGTPVIVYPGDGSPLPAQMAQVSVDDQGVPYTGPKGA